MKSTIEKTCASGRDILHTVSINYIGDCYNRQAAKKLAKEDRKVTPAKCNLFPLVFIVHIN